MFEPESPTMIGAAQAALRSIWARSMPLREKQEVVDAWAGAATKRIFRAGVRASLETGRLELDYRSFPGQFVVAILENWRRFQICANPDCSVRYFLSQRSTQRYCERGECTRYAVRKKARKWWTENRAKTSGED
jgi:hypothetical protein